MIGPKMNLCTVLRGKPNDKDDDDWSDEEIAEPDAAAIQDLDNMNNFGQTVLPNGIPTNLPGPSNDDATGPNPRVPKIYTTPNPIDDSDTSAPPVIMCNHKRRQMAQVLN